MKDSHKNDNAIELAKMILDWWEESQFDTISLGGGEEDNYWHDTPDFVLKAQQLIPDYKPKNECSVA